MNVKGRLMPYSGQGEISSTAEGQKNPNLIVRAFGLISLQQERGILFCCVGLQASGNG